MTNARRVVRSVPSPSLHERGPNGVTRTYKKARPVPTPQLGPDLALGPLKSVRLPGLNPIPKFRDRVRPGSHETSRFFVSPAECLACCACEPRLRCTNVHEAQTNSPAGRGLTRGCKGPRIVRSSFGARREPSGRRIRSSRLRRRAHRAHDNAPRCFTSPAPPLRPARHPWFDSRSCRASERRSAIRSPSDRRPRSPPSDPASGAPWSPRILPSR